MFETDPLLPSIINMTPEKSPLDFRSLHSTVDDQGKRKWIYAIQPKGKYYNYRTWLSYLYFAVFFTLPFLKINGQPLFLFNIFESEIILFGRLFTPQDFIIFGIIMIVSIVIIVIFTMIYGRIFCGWICPQTIFMEMLFRKIEYWIEGNANQQRIRDNKKWTRDTYLRKTTKHTLFIVLSFLIAHTFFAYLIGVDKLMQTISEPLKDHWLKLAGLVVFTGLFYGVFAFVREIVCTVVCPYGRLQGVLMDKSSMNVSYDFVRGEPRNKKSKTEGAGDCIDCGMCVHVCPTGIDIRNGAQMECVGCTACMDACDMIMVKVGKEPKLITYASEVNIEEKKPFEFSTRIKVLTGVMVVLAVLLTGFILSRKNLDATIMRVPGQVLQENEDGTITNLYRIKITNKTNKEMAFELVPERSDVTIRPMGNKLEKLDRRAYEEETFFIAMPKESIDKRKFELKVYLMSGDRKIDTKKVVFIGKF